MYLNKTINFMCICDGLVNTKRCIKFKGKGGKKMLLEIESRVKLEFFKKLTFGKYSLENGYFA